MKIDPRKVHIRDIPKQLRHRRSVMTKDVWVTPVTPMKTRLVSSKFYGYKWHPPEFPARSPEGFVFALLGSIYLKAGNVKESQIKEVMFGFQQSGFKPSLVMDAFKALKQHGYMYFTDDAGCMLFGDPTPDMWFKFTPRFLDLVMTEPMTNEIKPEFKVDDAKI